MSEVVVKELPENWEFTPLSGLLIEFETGTRPKGGVGKYTEGTPSVGAEHLDADGGFKFKKIKFVPEEYANSMLRGHLEEGDILVVKDGATTAKTSLVRKSFPHADAVINEHVFRCKVAEGVEPKYVFYYLFSGKGQKEILSDFRGAAQGGITKGFADKVNIPLAPPEQQKRIVAKIEELFSHIDAGIEALKKAKQLLKQYRQSVLKAAVTGELTKEWREANKDKLEPATQLLERILIERRQKWEEQQLELFKAKGKIPKDDKWKEKYKEPLTPEFEHVSEVPDIPSTWAWVTVSQLTSFVKDGPHYSPKYAEKGIPFITGGNVRQHGVDFDNCKYITEELHEELTKRCKPELNDILYTKGGTTGIARVNTYDFEFNVWVHVAVLRLVNSDFIAPFYMQHALNSLLCYAQSQKYTHGVGNQDLGLTRMIKICLALPPVDEQREIIEIINNKMDSIDRIEEQVDHMLVMGVKNKQAVLSSSFSGNLS